jgi:hypothetical protein
MYDNLVLSCVSSKRDRLCVRRATAFSFGKLLSVPKGDMPVSMLSPHRPHRRTPLTLSLSNNAPTPLRIYSGCARIDLISPATSARRFRLGRHHTDQTAMPGHAGPIGVRSDRLHSRPTLPGGRSAPVQTKGSEQIDDQQWSQFRERGRRLGRTHQASGVRRRSSKAPGSRRRYTGWAAFS